MLTPWTETSGDLRTVIDCVICKGMARILFLVSQADGTHCSLFIMPGCNILHFAWGYLCCNGNIPIDPMTCYPKITSIFILDNSNSPCSCYFSACWPHPCWICKGFCQTTCCSSTQRKSWRSSTAGNTMTTDKNLIQPLSKIAALSV